MRSRWQKLACWFTLTWGYLSMQNCLCMVGSNFYFYPEMSGISHNPLTCSNCFAINPSLQTDQMKISRRESEQNTDLIIWVQLRSPLRFSAWLPISWPSSHNPTFGELVSKLRAWLAGSNFYFHPQSAMSWISHNPLTYCSHSESNEVDICNELSKKQIW